MAAPHVAGVVALLLGEPSATTPVEVEDAPFASATAGTLEGIENLGSADDPNESPDRLLFSSLSQGGDSGEPEPEPDPAASLSVSEPTVPPATATDASFEVASGTITTISVDVVNSGGAPATTTTVTLGVTDSGGSVTDLLPVTFAEVATDSTATATFTWDTTGLPEGSYTLAAAVTEASSAALDEARVTVTLVAPGLTSQKIQVQHR